MQVKFGEFNAVQNEDIQQTHPDEIAGYVLLRSPTDKFKFNVYATDRDNELLFCVALIKVLEDKLSDIALCHQADVEWQKKITLDFFIALLGNEYEVGYKDGYEVGDMHGYERLAAEHNSERCDNYQSAWEEGYNQGCKEGHINGRDQS